jgi:hypothetical protein
MISTLSEDEESNKLYNLKNPFGIISKSLTTKTNISEKIG